MYSNKDLLYVKNDEDLYFKKYINYKKKYLNSNQIGGHSDQYYIYFCFKKDKTENALKTLNLEYNIYDIKDIDSNLHLGAYKSNFSNELDLVIAPNSERKLKKSKKLVSKLFTKNPLDRMKTISRINLLKIIKELEKKINLHEEKKPEEAKTEEKKPDEKKPEETKTEEKKPEEASLPEDEVHICSVLMFKYEQNNMSLVLNYKVENNELIDQDVNDDFQIMFVNKIDQVKKPSFFKSFN